MSIYKTLSDIQVALKAPKNQRNNFGGYNYRSCEDILEGVKPLLKQYGVSLILSDEIEMIGSRYYVKATARLVSDSGETVYATGYAREADAKKGMDEAQITGASSSYARKYALNALLAIDDTKDADSTNTHGKDDTGLQVMRDSLLKSMTVDELKQHWEAIPEELQTNPVLVEAKKSRYRVINKKEAK